MKKEQLRMHLSEAVGDYFLKNIHSDIYGQDNFKTAKDYLADGGSLIVIANHFAKLDVALHANVLRKNLTSFDHISGIVSRRHLDPKRGLFNRVQGALTEDWEKIYKGTFLQAVQRKDRGYYLDAAVFNRNMLSKAQQILEQPGNVLFITPEGTRSNTNKLLRAEDGLDILLIKLRKKKVLVLPLAAKYKTVLPGRKIPVTAGKPFGYQDLVEDRKKYLNYYEPIWREMGVTDPKNMPDITLTDCAMARLGENLPTENMGVYTQLIAIRRKFS